MPKLAMTFPGQGSQSVGMLADLAATYALVKHTFEEASDALGQDLWFLAQQGPDDQLKQTQNTQPAMLAAGIAVWRVWSSQSGAAPMVLAGHSLGEYSALVAAEVLPFSDAVKLVAERGRLMQEAVPQGQGAMAAVLGLDDAAVVQVCEQAAEGEVAAAVNFNSPGQVVIAGHSAAIARACDLAKQAGAKRALMLDVSVPSHCSLMHDAADRLAETMQSITFGAPRTPVLHNVNVGISESVEQIQQRLVEQLYSPVRWVESVTQMADMGAELFVECGPGKVLTGLNKRINKQLSALAIFDSASMDSALEAAQDQTLEAANV